MLDKHLQEYGQTLLPLLRLFTFFAFKFCSRGFRRNRWNYASWVLQLKQFVELLKLFVPSPDRDLLCLSFQLGADYILVIAEAETEEQMVR